MAPGKQALMPACSCQGRHAQAGGQQEGDALPAGMDARVCSSGGLQPQLLSTAQGAVTLGAHGSPDVHIAALTRTPPAGAGALLAELPFPGGPALKQRLPVKVLLDLLTLPDIVDQSALGMQ